jgi:toxin FitB
VYLLDTNIISELRRPKPHGGVLAWFGAARDSELHISAVSIGEIQSGIEITRMQAPAKAAEIEAWLDQLLTTQSILAMDAVIFRCWGRLMHQRSDTAIEDAMIAATAIVNDLTVVTRNVRDFKSYGVRLLNPFETRR